MLRELFVWMTFHDGWLNEIHDSWLREKLSRYVERIFWYVEIHVGWLRENYLGRLRKLFG